MYAIISTGGKQLTVRSEEIVAMERLAGEVGSKITFDKVLAIGEGAGLKVGAEAADAKVEAEIVEHFRGPKLIAFKMKRRKGYRRRKGHRQELTRVKILSVG
ncbi:MAG: 50S ribosomal protein L21 [Lentisphaeria bacterium]|nr:50S ribosomal protein L21 [Lentisphaeria bacterium]